MMLNAADRVRLAQTTNKCTEDDLAYYVQECGEILGVGSAVQSRDDPKAILQYIFSELVKYKKHNQD